MSYYDEEIEIFNNGKIDSFESPPPSIQETEIPQFSQKMSLKSEELRQMPMKPGTLKPTAPVTHHNNESFDSDSELTSPSEERDLKSMKNEIKLTEHWKSQSLDVPDEIKECFQYIAKFSPQAINIEYRLQPFMPDYVPAVGDVDAFLKIAHAEEMLGGAKQALKLNEFVANLGLTILDEPSGQQSEPNLLQIKLRSVMPSVLAPNSAKVGCLVAKNSKDIDKWVTEIKQYHLNEPRNLVLLKNLPDIDALMAEWPSTFEQVLGQVGFPPADLECSLSKYIKIVCTIFDIPIVGSTREDYVLALSTLFNLYLAVEYPNESEE